MYYSRDTNYSRIILFSNVLAETKVLDMLQWLHVQKTTLHAKTISHKDGHIQV